MIGVTGATGHLGRLVIEALLERGIPPSRVVALARDPKKAADLASRGVQVRHADYDRPDTLTPALKDVSRLLLISASEVGKRATQHRNVIDVARRAGIELLVYTSMLHADTSGMKLVGEHRDTEGMIRDSGIPHVILRNGWYVENYTDQLSRILDQGALLGSAGNGRVSAATRADLAQAAAAVLSAPSQPRDVYELGGDEAFTLPELAAELTRQSGTPVKYRDLPAAEYSAQLTSAGLPKPYADILADSDAGLERGELYTDSGDLAQLLGRPTTPLASAVGDALAAHVPG